MEYESAVTRSNIDEISYSDRQGDQMAVESGVA